MGLPIETNMNHKNTKESTGSSKTLNVNPVNQGSAVTTGVSQLPEFQISVPEPFHISQPNFYTEVNPINLSTTDVNVSNRSTTNFAHTASIDEDYDT